MRFPSLAQIVGLSSMQMVAQPTPATPYAPALLGQGYTAGLQLASMDRLPPNRRANILHMLVEALAYINEQWLEENGAPSLYSVAPSYQLKVRPMQIDLWADIPTVMAQGGGDCKDFTAWRIAELRRAGQAMVVPEIRYLPQLLPTGETVHLWHVLVRQGAKTEDPSLLLGMPTRVSPGVLRGVFR